MYYCFLGIIPQLIGVSPEKAIKLSVSEILLLLNFWAGMETPNCPAS